MHASWKTLSSALLVLILAGTAGCAAGAEQAAGDGADLAAAEADETPGPAIPGEPPGSINVIVNVDDNDTLGGHHHHHLGGGHGWGGQGIHGGHHGCGGGPVPTPATLPAPPPPVPPPPPPAT